MKTRHCGLLHVARSSYSAYSLYFGEVSVKASYADFAYAARSRLPIPHTSRSGFPRGEPAVSDATTGLNLSIFRFPPHGRPSSRGQLSLLDANYTKFTGLKSQCESQTYHTSVRCPSSFVLSCAVSLATPCLLSVLLLGGNAEAIPPSAVWANPPPFPPFSRFAQSSHHSAD